jgi:hypothetical protein
MRAKAVLTSTLAMLDAVECVERRNRSKEELVAEDLQVAEQGLLV